jgi:ribonucleoside-diphosphate reductase alpha chain
MVDSMAELKGEMVIGGGWHLGSWFGRSSTKSAVMQKKRTTSPISFARNYQSKWAGAGDNALVDINKLMNLRVISTPEFKSDGKSEYILGIDVARSESKSNNQSSVAVLKLFRNKNQKITLIGLVNIINISNALTFSAQAVEVKKIQALYRAKCAVVDSNGLGKLLPLYVVIYIEKFSEPRNLGCVA